MTETKEECKRCGKCCANLWLALSPADLQTKYTNWLSGNGERTADIHLIYPMLKLVEGPTFDEKTKVKRWIYRCTHLRQKSLLDPTVCTIYAHRPDMCRNFPHYGDKIVPGSLEIYEGCAFGG